VPLRKSDNFTDISCCCIDIVVMVSFRCSKKEDWSDGVIPFSPGILEGSCIRSDAVSFPVELKDL